MGRKEISRGIVANSLDYNKQLRIPVTLLRSLKPLETVWTPYPPSYCLNCTTTIILQEGLWHEKNSKSLNAIEMIETETTISNVFIRIYAP